MGNAKKYYLVSGACGQVGNELIKKLGKKAVGFDVKGCDGKKILYADLTKKETLIEILNKYEICGVYHPAAIIDFYKKNVEEVNVQGTGNLLEAIVETGKDIKFFVNFGTGGCYGSTPEEGAKETDLLKPIEKCDPYVKSKIKQEKIAFEFQKEAGMPVINVRPGMIYNKEDKFRWGMHGLIVLGSLGFSQITVENGKYKIHAIHSKDVVNAIMYLAQKAEKGMDGIIGETFNIADSTPMSLKEFMTIVAKETKSLPPTLDFPEYMVKKEMDYAKKAIPFILKMLVPKTGPKEPVKSFNLPPEGISDFLFEHHVFNTDKIRALGWNETVQLKKELKNVIKYKIKQGSVPKDATLKDIMKYLGPLIGQWMLGKYGIET